MRKTKIVCTLGPATDGEGVLREMMLAGMNVARFNFSHGTHPEHKARLEQVKALRKELGLPVAAMLDTKGPEVRLKNFAGGSVTLQEGQEFTLTVEDVEGDATRCAVTYAELPQDVKAGDTILLDDGLVRLTVLSTTASAIRCRVENGGVMKDHKGVNVPGVSLSMPYMSAQDRADIRFGIDIRGGVDVTFMPADGVEATDDQMTAAKTVIEDRLVGLGITDYEDYVDYNKDRIIVRFPWKTGETDFNPQTAIDEIGTTAEMVFRKGMLTCSNGAVHDFEAPRIEDYLVERAHDTFHVAHLTAEDFSDGRPHAVIGMIPGEIVTQDAGYADHADPEQDILKIAVIERHKNTHHIGLGYIKGYGLKRGAVATSISHDSHNIIVVGATDEDMAAAANRIVENRGGITVMENGQVLGEVTLSIAGIMSDDSLVMVNSALEDAKDEAFGLGVSRGIDPFMTLSFMALPVIPSLRITTRGVFDVTTQSYV